MLPAVIFILLVDAVATIAWRTRNTPSRMRCCSPGAWPPTDLDARPGTSDRGDSAGAPPVSGMS